MSGFFADDIDRHGSAPALLGQDGAIVSYADLAGRADTMAARIGSVPQLVLVEAENTIDAAVLILACLRGRHPLIITSSATRGPATATFNPNIVMRADGGWTERHRQPVRCHPDLAVMLSTSGSTGATKLVRLSRDAVHANAAAIADYLHIGVEDRALTTLPISYSYGLSVLNSHLFAGAAIIMTDLSVVDERLWNLFTRHEGTSIAGVPYTYELLEASGFRERNLASLRTMTQAGGRLPPTLVETYHRWSQDRGVSFFTMYGQTEATARMAYLPPELMADHTDCIGKAIPGGTLRILDEDGRPVLSGTTGELVYTGPNVMMGYATAIEDLAKDTGPAELRTGDLGQEVEEGLFRVVGRSSRFSKIAGLRVGFDEIEQLLAGAGIGATVAGNDTLVTVAVPTPEDAAQARALIDTRTTIPARSLIVVTMASIPRLVSGKIDYPAVLAFGAGDMARSEKAADQAARESGESPLATVYARALNRRSVVRTDSFASLAGDSLAYIAVSMAIEEQLGTLPDAWEQLSIGQIETLAAAAPTAAGPRRTRSVATEMLIRPVAMTMVITGHIVGDVGGLAYKGGALALMMTAGYNAARFQRDKLASPRRLELLGQFFVRFLIPYYLLLAIKASTMQGTYVSWSTLTVLGNYYKDTNALPFGYYWFIQALFQMLLLVIVLFSIPPVRRFATTHRWSCGLTFLAVATAVKFGVPAVSPSVLDLKYRLGGWAYAYAIGWLVADAQSLPRRLFCVAAALLLSGFDWGFGNLHNLALVAATALVLFVPRIPVWAPLAGLLAFFAQSTFYIYLSHGATNRLFDRLHIHYVPLVVCMAIGIGMIAYVCWRSVELFVVRLLHRFRAIPQHAMTDL